jgi:hypothetical protein
MSSKETTSPIEVGEQPAKRIKIKFKFTLFLKKHYSCIKIQACWMGYKSRKHFKKQDDKYCFTILNKCLDKYLADLDFNDQINILMSQKKRRNENFPSDISENIAKFAIYKKYGIMPCWDTKKGDLNIDKSNIFKQIEVKGFMSTGPSSFGPTETWDWIYFVDGLDVRNKNFKVYEIKLSNRSEAWRSIKINEKETYGEIADKNQRGKLRADFYNKFKTQLGNHCKLIFDGHISKLDNSL